LVVKLQTTPEKPKENLRKKLNFYKILNVLSEVPAFKEELMQLCLPLLQIDALYTNKDFEVHEAMIKLIENLYVLNGSEGASMGQISLILSNLILIAEAIAEFMIHEETRISQKALISLEKVIRLIVKVD
jgi:hypothetical protein